MSTVDEIKARVDIIELVSETVNLRRSGKSYTGFCPFHQNVRTPAFVVFPETGTWRCFSCNEGGDIFSFLMKKEGWDFSQTLRFLAQRAGVELVPFTPEKKEADDRLDRLRGLLDETVTFYQHNLLQTSAGEIARSYLQKRGLQANTIETFGLGYSPNSWDLTNQYFLEKGYSAEELLETGIAGERQNEQGIYDRFRHRLMFPIRDSAGRMAGFGARSLQDEDQPKYLNSPQTKLFDKSNLLYGLDLARRAIRREDQVVIVEGYMDVIGLHQGGFLNAVAPMGTALNEHQFRLLKRFTRQIVLALDADDAGERATLRGLELARQAMDRSADFVPDAGGLFDARGLIRYEARLQADLRVTTLPAGMDPDEVVLRNPEEWVEIIAAALPIVEHVMNTLTANRDMDDPKVKREVAEQVLPLIEDVASAIERDGYRQHLARLLRVDERVLLASHTSRTRQTNRPGRGKRSVTRSIEPMMVSTPETLALELEIHCLRILLRHPEALNQVDRALQNVNLSRLVPQDFVKADHQLLARLVQYSLEQDQLEPAQYVNENLPEPLGDLIKS
ncbi:MAG: DNA primase, partial [Anaerolineaceae bacterium]|nr:DNA primase [Anaerolineaceae bacterium]